MTRSIVWFLLVLSLLFNMFFVVGYMQARASTQLQNIDSVNDTNRVTDLVSHELKLNDNQREMFSKLRGEMRVFEESIALAIQELLNELEKEQPDLDRIRDMVTNQSELNNQRHSEGSQRFNEFVRILSPDQCKKLSDRVGRSRHGRDRFQRMLRKYDENKNGKLDEDEMVKARAAHSARREQWKQEMLEKYDANRDGVLDENERGAVRENWNKQRRGRHKDGPKPPRDD